jgi:hypothetical protein
MAPRNALSQPLHFMLFVFPDAPAKPSCAHALAGHHSGTQSADLALVAGGNATRPIGSFDLCI